MPRRPVEPIKKKQARLARIAGLRGETLREQKEHVAYARVGPAWHKYIEGAAAGGCPIAANLLAQFHNAKWIFPDERRQGRNPESHHAGPADGRSRD